MSRPSFRVHLVRHHDGRLTGSLISSSGWVADPPTGYGDHEDEVLSQLALALEEKPELVPSFLWTETLTLRRLTVSVHPQAIVKRRHVIGREAIELQLVYASSELEAGGYRVLVPRFGWWFVLEDLSMAATVIRQVVSTDMLGENARSLYAYRDVGEERVIEWSPTLGQDRRPRATAEDEERRPTLHAVAEDLGAREHSRRRRPVVGDLRIEEHLHLANRERPRSILLVGPSGCGKTTWVRAFARRLARPTGSGTPRRVWSTTADRIVAGMSYLGQWEQRCLDLVAELSGEGDYLYVGELPPLCAPQTGRTSIADMLLPALNADEISLVAECTSEELERLATHSPALIGRFHVIRLRPPHSSAMIRMLEEYRQRIAPDLRIDGEGLRRLVQHLEFFQRDVAFPGKGIRFLDWLAQEQKGADPQVPPLPGEPHPVRTLRPADVSAGFARSTGLPIELISDAHVAGRELVASRLREGVIGQDAACQTAARVLTRFKAGIGDPDRPIGSLFFVGPTGVGKTELAKQLARYMFGGTDKMVRLDMSEFMLPGSAGRMLAVGHGGRSLVERVRQRPLGLVLLDEIEKAHPEVFDLLLAMLGEGRMTDLSGRLVDFRMTLVVMTSNLGVREHASAGFADGSQAESDLLVAVRKHFRPEFFNRIDHVIPFRPLGQDDLLRIVDLEIRKASDRTGLTRRGLRLTVDPAARELLARLGHHPTRGARPLKRVIEERIMTPLSIRLAADHRLRDRPIRVVVQGSPVEAYHEQAGETVVSLTPS